MSPSLVERLFICFFFFNDTATTEIYTLSLHDALPIRFLPLALGPVTEVRLVSALSESADVVQEAVVAFVHARLASGREISLPMRAGLDTAEWAWDRPDVRARVAHYRAPVAESWPAPDGSFQGHRYQALLRLPGRYWVDGVRLERAPGRGVL